MRSAARNLAQVSLSLVLLVGAGLFARSLQRALATDLGFDGRDVALASVNVGLARYDSARAARFYAEVTERISVLPEVQRVSWATTIPLTTDENTESFRVEGYVPRPDERLHTEVNAVAPGFFESFGIALVRGRVFGSADGAGSQPVAVVNETMARRYWRDGDPIGRRVQIYGDTVTVVGVVRDIRYHELREEPRPYMYFPLAQQVGSVGLHPMHLIVQRADDPEAAIAGMRRAIREAGADVPTFDLGTFASRAGQATRPQRLGAWILGAFSGLALVIAAVGVYGVVAYAVARRTREIGIRMALGARAASVVRMLLAENLAYVLIGTAIGLAMAAMATRAMSGLLYGVSATDGLTYAATSLILIAVGVVAAAIPARRATRVDPVSALRSD